MSERDQPTSISVAIERGVRADLRPFAAAVDASGEPTASARAISVWRLTLDALFEAIAEHWSIGASIDPFDGVATMRVDAFPPAVHVEFDAPTSRPDPMHLRSVVHLAERLRPAIRREAAISDHELDREIGSALRRAADRFPVLATPDPVTSTAMIDRLTERWPAEPSRLAALV
ncbi:MAG: hypothetical protein AAGG08_15630 [Actinomycetota bacterium]